MKRLVYSLILILVAAMASNAMAQSARNVYYVVTGSYSSLSKAQKATQANDAVYPIYEVTANGKKAYRICPQVFTSKGDAQLYASEYKRCYGTEAWVWQSQGQAKLVAKGDSEESHVPYTSVASGATAYYVVISAVSSLDAARKFAATCPDGMECPAYETTVNGKKVYRLCLNHYKTKKEADEMVALLREREWTACVWKHNGPAKCVMLGGNLAGKLNLP